MIVFPLISFYGFNYIEQSSSELEEQSIRENRKSEIFYNFVENIYPKEKLLIKLKLYIYTSYY